MSDHLQEDGAAEDLAATRTREAATREILEVISQSREDEQPVFDAIINRASQLCNAPHAGLLLRDAEDRKLVLVAANAAQSGYVDHLRENPHSMDDESSLSVEAVRAMKVRQYPDIEALEDGTAISAQLQNTWKLERMRTLLYVPLIKGDRAIGVIGVYRLHIEEFSDADIEMLKLFAAQAVIAIENVRQFRELQTRLEREAATREILDVIARSRDDEGPVFEAILESAARLCNAPIAFLSLADPERTQVLIPAHRGTRSEFGSILDGFVEPISRTELVAVRPIVDGQVVRESDIKDDETYRKGDPRRRQMVDVEGARSVLGVPLIQGETPVGAIILYRREVQPFTEDDVSLIENFAAQAVIAIENVRQFKALEARTEEVQVLNASLEERVRNQVGEIERMGRLKRFLSPAVAEAVVTKGEDMLASHRAFIAVLFCDIRGFTAFCETAEPEETIEFLQTYHREMGKLIAAHGAGVDHRSGDGIMVIFNDPLPVDDPAGLALDLARAMRERMSGICANWRKLGYRLGFGTGLSLGYATVGMVGSEGRYDYTANGPAVNLAARLCENAQDGEILLSPRAFIALEDRAEAEPTGALVLKGISNPVEAMKLRA